MRFLLSILISCGPLTALSTTRAGESASPRLKAYYTRLPFEDHGFTGNIEAMVMYGLTDRAPGELTALNRSWNFAPAVTETSGCVSHGYERRERAFKFTQTGEAAAFTVQATKQQPLENPAFIIGYWGSPKSSVALKINGRTRTYGVDYRSGTEVDTDGTYTLVNWLPLSATETVSFAVRKKE